MGQSLSKKSVKSFTISCVLASFSHSKLFYQSNGRKLVAISESLIRCYPQVSALDLILDSLKLIISQNTSNSHRVFLQALKLDRSCLHLIPSPIMSGPLLHFTCPSLAANQAALLRFFVNLSWPFIHSNTYLSSYGSTKHIRDGIAS